MISGARAVRLLVDAGLSNEALGMGRMNIETLAHIEALATDPGDAIALLTQHIMKGNNGAVPQDAQTVLNEFKGEELRLLATIYVHWCQRHTQKAANDAARSPSQTREGVKEAPGIASEITKDTFGDFLDTRGMPDPDLLIRTSGEYRISNFLLWQLSYAELWVTPVLWPDFRRKHLIEALNEYAQRDRRFGGVG